MRVKRYVADSIHEAILQVKSDLGRDALILHTKTFKVGGFLGLFARKRVEVIAALDENAEKLPAESGKQKNTQTEKTESVTDSLEITEKKNADLTAIQAEMAQLREAIKEVATCLNAHAAAAPEQLTPAKPAAFTAEQLREEFDGERELIGEIQIPPIGGAISLEKRPMLVALVGPTGVGKTTTIAKLAAHFVLFERAKVALITIDTYRIAAVEQLKTYAEIINLPVSVVYTPEDYEAAVNNYANYDLILVDTAGRSQKNSGQIQELKGFITKCAPDEIHLVISATTKAKDMEEIAEAFRGVCFNRIIFSKLDETNEMESLFSLAGQINVPVSYLTTGQNVPDDIEVATVERLSRLMNKELRHA